MYQRPEIHLVVLGLPNYLHCDAVIAAAQAGKHVVLEKPMAMNLAECDQMIEACRRANVKLMYAEELCFCAEYTRLKQLVDSGGARQAAPGQADGKAQRPACCLVL